MLHGAGGHARRLASLLSIANSFGVVLLVPDSRGTTWDAIRGGYGPDVEFINRALDQTFARCAVDQRKLAIGGFSDGATYALSLGLDNGSLFTHVMAFSPGFIAARRPSGKPRIFISHGRSDAILPIDVTSRRIVPELEDAGYAVTYKEFDGPHTVPQADRAGRFKWFTPAESADYAHALGRTPEASGAMTLTLPPLSADRMAPRRRGRSRRRPQQIRPRRHRPVPRRRLRLSVRRPGIDRLRAAAAGGGRHLRRRALHQHVRWEYVRRMLLPACIGVVLAALSMSRISDAAFRPLIGWIVLALAVMQAARQRWPNWMGAVPHTRTAVWVIGLIAGGATMLANAAGPVVSLYCIAVGLPKFEVVGTLAWFFLIVNVFKLPFSAGLGLIRADTLLVAVVLLPAVVTGVFSGRWILHRLPQRVFDVMLIGVRGDCGAAADLRVRGGVSSTDSRLSNATGEGDEAESSCGSD